MQTNKTKDYIKEKEISERAIEYSKQAGAQSVRVIYNTCTSDKFTIANGELDKSERSIDNAISLQLFIDGKYGSYSTNKLSENEIKNFIKDAVEITKSIASDNCRALPDKHLYFHGKIKDLGQYDPFILTMQPERKIELAINSCNEIIGKDKRLIYAESVYEDGLYYQYLTDSNGFHGENLQSSFSVYSECSIQGSQETRPSGWWYDNSMQFNNLQPLGIGETALSKAISKLNAKKTVSGKMNVLIDKTCSSRFVGPIFLALNGRMIYQKSSFLIGTLGKKVFSDKFTINDTPHEYGMSGSRYFDDEGIATRSMKIIDNGIINTYYIDTYSSRKLDMEPTIGSASVPTVMPYGIDNKANDIITQDEMIATIDNGIFITGINGGNCNNTTGDFSFGIEGFVFKNGKILHPVNEMNITGNIISLWEKLIMVGNDARKSSDWQIPSLAFESVNII